MCELVEIDTDDFFWRCDCAAPDPPFLKSVYHNSLFSGWVKPHKFIDFAYLYMGGMQMCKIQEALNLGLKTPHKFHTQ